MKTSKITKREINETLRSLDRTAIFRLAKKCGIDVTNQSRVYHFILENAPTQKLKKAAYGIALYAPNYKEFKYGFIVSKTNPILDAINFAKEQKKNNWMQTNYGKVLIEGDRNIYWAHPQYQHADYNKSRALVNNERNRRVANVINQYLLK
jgi:hypothetical protein